MTAPAPTPTPIESLWTVKEVMAALALKRTAVYDLVHKGDLPHLWLGSRLRFEPDQVRAWLKTKRSTAPSATVLPISRAK